MTRKRERQESQRVFEPENKTHFSLFDSFIFFFRNEKIRATEKEREK